MANRLWRATDYKHEGDADMCIVYRAGLSVPSVYRERGSAVSNIEHMLTLEPKIIFGNKWQKARCSAHSVDISLIGDSWPSCLCVYSSFHG